MSTNSVVAVPQGDGWKGRHTHWDGDPQFVGRDIWHTVVREGVDTARKVYVEDHTGWSTLDHEQLDFTTIKVPWNATTWTYPRGSDKYKAVAFRDTVDTASGRFVNVPGYGVGYTELQGDHWYTSENVRPGDAAWVYVITDGGLFVVYCGEYPVGIYRWDDPEPDWADVTERSYKAAEAAERKVTA